MILNGLSFKLSSLKKKSLKVMSFASIMLGGFSSCTDIRELGSKR